MPLVFGFFASVVSGCAMRGHSIHQADAARASMLRTIELGPDRFLVLGQPVHASGGEYLEGLADGAPCSVWMRRHMFKPPLAHGLAGVTAIVDADRRIAIIHGHYADPRQFASVAVRWQRRLGRPDSVSSVNYRPAVYERRIWREGTTRLEPSGMPNPSAKAALTFALIDESSMPTALRCIK